jgi:acetyl esterase/lipase
MAEETRRPMVVLCPGGAYWFVADREADPIAYKLLSMNMAVAIVYYTTKNEGEDAKPFPEAISQVARTIAYFRRNADDYYIDPNEIYVMGFSAGGHLAASMGIFWDEEWLLDTLNGWDLKLCGYNYDYESESKADLVCDTTECDEREDNTGTCKTPLTAADIRPNRMILCYPVISSGEYAHKESFYNLTGQKEEDAKELWEKLSLEKQVKSTAPPTFLWHTFSDEAVSVWNSLLLAQALHRAGVDTELHVYQLGRHGLSLGKAEFLPVDGQPKPVKEVENWPELLEVWLKLEKEGSGT